MAAPEEPTTDVAVLLVEALQSYRTVRGPRCNEHDVLRFVADWSRCRLAALGPEVVETPPTPTTRALSPPTGAPAASQHATLDGIELVASDSDHSGEQSHVVTAEPSREGSFVSFDSFSGPPGAAAQAGGASNSAISPMPSMRVLPGDTPTDHPLRLAGHHRQRRGTGVVAPNFRHRDVHIDPNGVGSPFDLDGPRGLSPQPANVEDSLRSGTISPGILPPPVPRLDRTPEPATHAAPSLDTTDASSNTAPPPARSPSSPVNAPLPQWRRPPYRPVPGTALFPAAPRFLKAPMSVLEERNGATPREGLDGVVLLRGRYSDVSRRGEHRLRAVDAAADGARVSIFHRPVDNTPPRAGFDAGERMLSEVYRYVAASVSQSDTFMQHVLDAFVDTAPNGLQHDELYVVFDEIPRHWVPKLPPHDPDAAPGQQGLPAPAVLHPATKAPPPDPEARIAMSVEDLTRYLWEHRRAVNPPSAQELALFVRWLLLSLSSALVSMHAHSLPHGCALRDIHVLGDSVNAFAYFRGGLAAGDEDELPNLTARLGPFSAATHATVMEGQNDIQDVALAAINAIVAGLEIPHESSKLTAVLQHLPAGSRLQQLLQHMVLRPRDVTATAAFALLNDAQCIEPRSSRRAELVSIVEQLNVLRDMGQPVLGLDGAGYVVYANNAAVSLVGWDIQESEQRAHADDLLQLELVTPTGDRAAWMRQLLGVLRCRGESGTFSALPPYHPNACITAVERSPATAAWINTRSRARTVPVEIQACRVDFNAGCDVADVFGLSAPLAAILLLRDASPAPSVRALRLMLDADRVLARYVPQPWARLDATGSIEDANEAFVHLFDAQRAQLVGAPTAELITGALDGPVLCTSPAGRLFGANAWMDGRYLFVCPTAIDAPAPLCLMRPLTCFKAIVEVANRAWGADLTRDDLRLGALWRVQVNHFGVVVASMRQPEAFSDTDINSDDECDDEATAAIGSRLCHVFDMTTAVRVERALDDNNRQGFFAFGFGGNPGTSCDDGTVIAGLFANGKECVVYIEPQPQQGGPCYCVVILERDEALGGATR